MPTIITHPVIAVSLSPWMLPREKLRLILITGMILTILPDVDVLGLKLGVPYLHLFGHRGFTHSIFFALLVSGVVSWWLSRRFSLRLPGLFFYLFLCALSHGVLDAMTNGGHGIAFLSPFSNERFFFPFQLIEVSPLSLKHFLSGRGYEVLLSELYQVWVPAMGVYFVGWMLFWGIARINRKSGSDR